MPPSFERSGIISEKIGTSMVQATHRESKARYLIILGLAIYSRHKFSQQVHTIGIHLKSLSNFCRSPFTSRVWNSVTDLHESILGSVSLPLAVHTPAVSNIYGSDP
jgi:hypothetical protein